MTAWAWAWGTAHPQIAAGLCVAVVLAAGAGMVLVALRLMRDPGEHASGGRPGRETAEHTGQVDSSPSALMARLDASLTAHEDAPKEAPGEMPAGQDDPGPLYSWSTGQFAAVMADDGPEVA